MEYLKSIKDKLKKFNEDNIEYVDLFDYPELFHGNINFTSSKLDFSKIPQKTRKNMEKFGKTAVKDTENFYNSSAGVRLRFQTDSIDLIFKVKLKHKLGYEKSNNWNSMGFDVFDVDKKGNYIQKGLFGPGDRHNVFAQRIRMPKSGKICIFLPNFNTIEKFYLGINKGSSLKPFNYPGDKKLPIIFYGSSVTQGASASRSSNSFPNIVSKKLNRDIINISALSGCRGNEDMAITIGKLNCHSIVIDYASNFDSIGQARKYYENFYKTIRKFHPDKKIILMTTSSFNKNKLYSQIDDYISQVYNEALERGENTELLCQTDLFGEEQYDYMTIDGKHYTDLAMFKIADKICEIIK